MTKIELVQINKRLAADNEMLRARVCQLEGDLLRVTECASAINHAHAKASHTAAAPVITQYVDCQGRLWVKTRIGNMATSRLA